MQNPFELFGLYMVCATAVCVVLSFFTKPPPEAPSEVRPVAQADPDLEDEDEEIEEPVDPIDAEIKVLKSGLAQIRAERSRMRKQAKISPQTDEEKLRYTELYDLMTRMRAKLRNLEERKRAPEQPSDPDE